MKDNFGIDIQPDDRVRVLAWGTARLRDVGTVSPVVRIGPVRLVIVDADGDGRYVQPGEVGVMRRDGSNGYEGNLGR